MARETAPKDWGPGWFREFLVYSQKQLGHLGAPRWIAVTLLIVAMYVVAVAVLLVISLPHGEFSLWPFAAITAFFGLLGAGAAWDVMRREKSFGEELVNAAEDLADFLGLPSRAGEVRFYVPSHPAIHKPDHDVVYNVISLAKPDVEAVIHLAHIVAARNLLDRKLSFDPKDVLVSEEDAGKFVRGVLFHIGGPLPNPFVRWLLNQDPFIRYQDVPDRADGSNAIVCLDPELGEFSTKPPRGDRAIDETKDIDTYGCVMRRRETREKRVFAVWGLDARGTLGAALWLVSSWHRIREEYEIEHEKDFTAVIRVTPPGSTPEDPVIVRQGKSALLLPRRSAEAA